MSRHIRLFILEMFSIHFPDLYICHSNDFLSIYIYVFALRIHADIYMFSLLYSIIFYLEIELESRLPECRISIGL